MSIDAPISRFGPADGAAGFRGSARPGWEHAENSTLTETQSMSFWDFLDIINPLQHLPLIGPVYRHMTGDELNGPARVLGGALYGGPVGLAKGVADAVVHQETGDYIGGHVMTAMLGSEPVQVDPGMVPAAEPDQLLALGPIAGQQVQVSGDVAATPAAQPSQGPVSAESSATAQNRATVMVQRDGTIVHLDEPTPMTAPIDGSRHYQVASRLDHSAPFTRNDR